MVLHGGKPQIAIRELETVADLESALELERNVWQCDASDVIPITLAVASRAAGSIWLGAFDHDQLVGFAFALPSLERGEVAFHSHTVGVLDEYQSCGVGYQLKLTQRNRALALGIRKMTWTFDPLRSRNAHLNFCKLGVVSDRYEIDFYGSKSSSPLHTNSTDRLWVTWNLAEARVEQRIKASGSEFAGGTGDSRKSQSPHPFDSLRSLRAGSVSPKEGSTRVGYPLESALRAEMLDVLSHLDPLVRFNGDGRPDAGDLQSALARQRIAIEIPGDMDRIERDDVALGREWRLATRHAFSEALKAGFIVKEFCRSVRGQQGPGAYLLERV